MSNAKTQIGIRAEIVQEAKDYLQSQVEEYLSDKGNSLEDRWEVWSKYSEKIHEKYLHHFEGFREFEDYLHNDFIQKYETLDFETILGLYDDYLIDVMELTEEESKVYVTSMKEYLMKKNLGSYKFDW